MLLREVLAEKLDRPTLERIVGSLITLSTSNNVTAQTLLLNYVLGKPSVGTAAAVADEAMSDAMLHNLSSLSTDELRAAREIALKIHGPNALTHQPGEVIEGNPTGTMGTMGTMGAKIVECLPVEETKQEARQEHLSRPDETSRQEEEFDETQEENLDEYPEED